MNIYFSCSITGGREDQSIYQSIVDNLILRGHSVLTAHLADPDLVRGEGSLPANLVYQRDVNWIHRCDAMVAEVSTPSHGVGYEIALALQFGIPVCCCYHSEKRVSKMILGNPDKNLRIHAYQRVEDALEDIDGFLQSIDS
jgi:nucleoside 2-deoxyribosyltransferase